MTADATTAGTTNGDLRGRIVLITGFTTGIGAAAALILARMGATIVGVSRERGRGEAAVARLRSAAGAGDRVHLCLADLESRDAVIRLADEVRARCDRLHVLVNNAGVIHLDRRVTPDGLEATFAVNHLAPFLLTTLLLDRLAMSAPARVVTVASEAHRVGRIDFADLQAERRYSWARAYSQSKLANILFTRELARRAAGSGVTANCLHPGGVRSDLWREMRGGLKVLLVLARPFMIAPEKGAEPLVRLAAEPGMEGVSGRYVTRAGEKRPSARARDDAAAARLWSASERLAGLARG
jgi:NAD(P)-dependent dehydrogenase (short-subunit alcohol dehydrogenase family)